MTIIIGVNGTSSGDDALVLGSLLARCTGDDMIVAVVMPAASGRGGPLWSLGRFAAMSGRADEVLARAHALTPADVRADFRAVPGRSAAGGLHALAEQVHASLIVLGSTGRGPVGRVLAGGTAARLLSGSPAPVAVAPREFRTQAPERLDQITAAYIDTPEGNVALDAAAALARSVDTRLLVITVVPSPDLLVPPPAQPPMKEFVAGALDSAGEALDLAVAGLPPELVRASEIVEADYVAAALADLPDTQLLVCGSRAYGPLRRVLLGEVSTEVIRTAAYPVLVVPRGSDPTLSGHGPVG